MNRIRFGIFLLFSLSVFPALHATEYKVAVRTHHGIEVANKQWQATMVYLSEQIPGHSFTLVPIINLKEISEAAGNGTINFVLTNPSSFVKIKKKYQANPLATLNNKRANTAQDRFGSVIFVNARNKDIFSINDLKNKSLMAVSESAFGGWRVAWLELLSHGIDPYKDLKIVLYSKNRIQQDVVYAVQNDDVDAGVVRTDQLERMEAAGKIDMRNFRVLNNKDIEDFPFFLSTDMYPEWAFAVMKSVPSDLAGKVQKTLLSITKNSPAALNGRYVGWLKPLDYSPVEGLMKRLKVGSYAHQ